jgi:hypothetical protein
MAEWPNVNTFGDIFLQMVRCHTPLTEGLPTAPRSLYLHHSPSCLLGAHDENVHDLHQRIRRRHRRMDQVQRQARVCRLYRGTRTVLMGVCVVECPDRARSFPLMLLSRGGGITAT